jgi:hypothetical protein
MPYTALIRRTNPSCFLFLIDQSGSMNEIPNPTNIRPAEEPFQNDGKTYTQVADGPTKAQLVADAINRLLQTLSLKCAKDDGVRDYFSVGVFGYGGDNSVEPAFSGHLLGRELVRISEIANNPSRIEERMKKEPDGAGGLVEQKIKFPIWFDAVANGGTPMCQALRRARSILEPWVIECPDSYPPVVINITDGESGDGDPTSDAAALKALSTNDGSVLLFNAHISVNRTNAIQFPASENGLPDQYAQMLFGMSSVLPPQIQLQAKQEGLMVSELSRGFVFNAKMEHVIQLMDIGTRTQCSNLR